MLIRSSLILVLLASTAHADDLTAWAKTVPSRVAYGRYIAGKKAGFVIEETKLGTFDGKDVMIVTTTEHSVTLSDGDKTVRDETLVVRYELANDGHLLYAKLRREENGVPMSIEVTRQDKGLRVTTVQGKRTLSRDIAQSKDNLRGVKSLQAWLTDQRKPGDKHTRYTLDLESETLDRKEVYVFGKKKEHTYEVTIETGGRWRAVLAENAQMISGSMGFWQVKREKEDEAKKLGEPPDLQEASLVPLDRDLGMAREVEELKLELRGLGDFVLPQSHRQTVQKEKDHTIVTLKRDFCVKKEERLSADDIKANTRSTPRYQSDQAAIVKKAQEIVGKETDPEKKARRIARWVHATLKETSANLETALEVLDQKEGDCTEFTLMFVALARAAGLPAREVSGLAYVKHKNRPRLGWHAWAEVHDGRQWISVDATWGQVFVDGTHLKLGDGDEDTAWANLVGQVQVKVVDLVRRK